MKTRLLHWSSCIPYPFSFYYFPLLNPLGSNSSPLPVTEGGSGRGWAFVPNWLPFGDTPLVCFTGLGTDGRAGTEPIGLLGGIGVATGGGTTGGCDGTAGVIVGGVGNTSGTETAGGATGMAGALGTVGVVGSDTGTAGSPTGCGTAGSPEVGAAGGGAAGVLVCVTGVALAALGMA